MYKWIISLILLISAGNIQAHNPDLSSLILAEKGDNQWVLQLRAALTGFEHQIEHAYGANAYHTAEEFQALVVEHVRKHIHIQANGTNTALLQRGVVKLGHETAVTFELSGIPAQLNSLTVSNHSFGYSPHAQSALIVVKEGYEKKQFMLKKSNGYTAALEVTPTAFTLKEDGDDLSQYGMLMFTVLCAMAVGIWWAFGARKSSAHKAMAFNG